MPSSRLANRVGGVARILRDRVLAPPRWWRELLLIGLIFGIYRWVQTIVPVDLGPAYARGRALLDAQQAMHLDVEHPLNAFTMTHPAFAIFANYYYVVCHGAVTCVVLIWLFWWHGRRYPAARLSLAVITVSAFAVFAVAPTAPPRLLSGAGFVDTLSHWHTIGGYQSGMMARTADQFAAMPSLHIGWAVWASLWLARVVRRLWARLVAIAYPLLTCVVILATANHYLLDIAGALVVVTAAELLTAAVTHHPTRHLAPAPATTPETPARAA